MTTEWEERDPPPRRGPSRAAAGLVRARAGLIVADWRSSGPDRPALDHAGVIECLIEAFERCGGSGPRGHHHAELDALFEEHRELLAGLDPSTVTALREVLRRQVLHGLGAAEALAALHCTSTVIDELLGAVTERSAAALARLAYVDELTGLPNRRAANDAVHAEVARAVRHRHDLAAVVIDVDHLKLVNDGEGHDAGDALLRNLAEAFRSGLREGDLAFRTGGDEFLVLLPETSLEAVDALVDRVGKAGAPTFSYGAAIAPGEADCVDDLLRIADQRLLASRRERRFPPSPAAESGAVRQAGSGRRTRRAESAISAAALLAVVIAVLGADQFSSALSSGMLAAILGCVATAAVIAAAGTSRERRRRITDALFVPVVVYGLASLLLHTLSPVRQTERRAELSGVTSSMPVQGGDSLGASTVRGAAGEAEIWSSGTTAPPLGLSVITTTTTTSTTTSSPPPVRVATTTTVPTGAAASSAADDQATTGSGTKGTTTTQPPRTTTTASPAGSSSQSSTPTSEPSQSTTSTTSTTAAPTTTTTTTTTTTPAREAQGRSDRRPHVRDDEVRTTRLVVVIEVLANDRGAPGHGGDLDPESLEIVVHPRGGSVEVRPDGAVRYRAREGTTADRFRYRVCTIRGSCGQAWVQIDRRSA